MPRTWHGHWPLLLLLWFIPLAAAEASSSAVARECRDQASAEKPCAAAIASAHPLATSAGHEILARGGNAFDAAVAVAAALAVVEPHGSGLGGGGFWLLHRAADGFETMLDARERAPQAATESLYLDAHGEPVPGLTSNGALATAIPGTPAALVHLAKKYGRLPLAQSLAPAVRLARAGFPVSALYQRMAQRRLDALRASPAAAKAFLENGEVPAAGKRIRQPDLARVLVRLGKDDGQDFYRGKTARALVAGVRAAGGVWTPEDLASYRVVEREPVRARYHGMRVTAAALPSSGGIVLAQMLGILAGFDLDRFEPVRRHHALIEAMRIAYRERAFHLGDPDYAPVPVETLLAPETIARLRQEVRELKPVAPVEGENTTHLSILDRDGNRVAATLSLNRFFGSGFMPPGTGVLLNDHMDDFVLKLGVPNVYGLMGSGANLVAPGKRPLSSMTPAFLETDDAVVVLGTPGGSRIITMVLLVALDVAAGRGDPEAWVRRPRFHHQYQPDQVEHEPEAFTPDEAAELTLLGHSLKTIKDGYGNMQLVTWFRKAGRVEAASDPRGEGAAEVR